MGDVGTTERNLDELADLFRERSVRVAGKYGERLEHWR
jgi:hypothetical protein